METDLERVLASIALALVIAETGLPEPQTIGFTPLRAHTWNFAEKKPSPAGRGKAGIGVPGRVVGNPIPY